MAQPLAQELKTDGIFDVDNFLKGLETQEIKSYLAGIGYKGFDQLAAYNKIIKVDKWEDHVNILFMGMSKRGTNVKKIKNKTISRDASNRFVDSYNALGIDKNAKGSVDKVSLYRLTLLFPFRYTAIHKKYGRVIGDLNGLPKGYAWPSAACIIPASDGALVRMYKKWHAEFMDITDPDGLVKHDDSYVDIGLKSGWIPQKRRLSNQKWIES